jgi:5-methyltetrahydropteroyltriglutamate--homocysteine methyltransferase
MAPKDFVIGDRGERRGMATFQDACLDRQSRRGPHEPFMTNHSPLANGPIKYKGHELIKRDIDNLAAGLDAAGLGTEDAWMNAIAPASCARMPNACYKSEEELLYACADALHEEYKAIIDAGLTVRLDDPAIGENWDQQNNEPNIEGYGRYTGMQINALNRAIKGLPPDKIRFHRCRGS